MLEPSGKKMLRRLPADQGIVGEHARNAFGNHGADADGGYVQ